MTSELKCPFCQQELKEIYCNGICVGLACKNVDCLETKSTLGNKALWQAVTRAKQDSIILTDSESRQITYMADGKTKVYYGRNGAEVETNMPLPVGFIITIKETTNDK